MNNNHPSQTLATFAANLRFEDIPEAVVRRAEDLFLDWFGSALAGKTGRPVQVIESFARQMGPQDGPSEVLISRRKTTPLFAAMVNAASSHFAEQDDVHNGSVFHPAAVVFPVALAVAQSIGASGRDLLAASVAGYEVGIRVGEFLGRSHYKIFHTTGTAGTVAAAAAAGHLLKLSPEQMLHAFGSAGTQAAGLWEFLRDAADSKQLHTAHAAAGGLGAAYLAHEGFTGARRILEGAQGMAAGMSRDADPARLTDRLGERWTLAETSFKFHASCRHTHPAADALLQVVQAHGLRSQDIARVTARVHQGAIDVLGPVVDPRTVHQAKFSMGTVLGLIAEFGSAGLKEFESFYNDPRIASFRGKAEMVLDAEVDQAYPARWIGKVTVHTADGRTLEGRVDEPKGDPGNTLSRDELESKALRLAEFADAASPAEMRAAFAHIWALADAERVGSLLAAGAQRMLARSYLFVPGNRPERFDKACAAGADAVIVDLEDAVPRTDKPAARAALAAWLSPEQRVLVRINGADSAWFEDDLALCSLPGVAGVVLPKAEHEASLAKLAAAGAAAILPLIESGLGLWNAAALARLPRVQRLVFGSIDFSFDMGIQEGHETLLYARSRLVLASRVAGIAAPVDGVTTTFDEPERVHADTLRARALGFGGKLCIHPKQVAPVHEAFAPTAEETAWAGRVVAAAAAAQGGAVALDGKMVDRPVLLIAQQMLEEAKRRK